MNLISYLFHSVWRFCSSCFFVVLGLLFSQHSWADVNDCLSAPTPAVGHANFGSEPIIVNPRDPIGTVIKRYPVTLNDVDWSCTFNVTFPSRLYLRVGLGPQMLTPMDGASEFTTTYCYTGVKGVVMRLRLIGDSNSVQYGPRDIDGNNPTGMPMMGLPSTGGYLMCGSQGGGSNCPPMGLGPCMTPPERSQTYGVRTRGAQFEVELVKSSMEPVNGALNLSHVLQVTYDSLLINISGNGALPVVTKSRTCTVAPGTQGKVWPLGQIDMHEIPKDISKVFSFPISLTCDAGATMKLQATGASPGQPAVLPNKQEAGYARGVGVALSYQGRAINFGEDLPIPVAPNDGPVEISLGANYQLVGGPVTPGAFFASATFTIIER